MLIIGRKSGEKWSKTKQIRTENYILILFYSLPHNWIELFIMLWFKHNVSLFVVVVWFADFVVIVKLNKNIIRNIVTELWRNRTREEFLATKQSNKFGIKAVIERDGMHGH